MTAKTIVIKNIIAAGDNQVEIPDGDYVSIKVEEGKIRAVYFNFLPKNNSQWSDKVTFEMLQSSLNQYLKSSN
jgi:hypothetical protein